MFDEDGLIAALPPDVRRGYASPVVTLLNTWGYDRRSASGP